MLLVLSVSLTNFALLTGLITSVGRRRSLFFGTADYVISIETGSLDEAAPIFGEITAT